GHALAHLEAGDGLARPRDHRLLAGDKRQILGRDRRLLGVARRLAHAHIDDDLLDARNLHLVPVAELLEKLLADHLLILLLQARLILCVSHRSILLSASPRAPSCRRPGYGSRRGSACHPWDRRSPDWKCGSALPW